MQHGRCRSSEPGEHDGWVVQRWLAWFADEWNVHLARVCPANGVACQDRCVVWSRLWCGSLAARQLHKTRVSQCQLGGWIIGSSPMVKQSRVICRVDRALVG
jgi:hypothetical protein